MRVGEGVVRFVLRKNFSHYNLFSIETIGIAVLISTAISANWGQSSIDSSLCASQCIYESADCLSIGF